MLTRIGKLIRPMSISSSCVLPDICLNQLSLFAFPTPGPSILDSRNDESISRLIQMSAARWQELENYLFFSQHSCQSQSDSMAAIVINPNDLCTSVQIRLKCTGFCKIFGKQSLIHPTLRSGPIRNPWNVVIESSNRIFAISILKMIMGASIKDQCLP
jgi:hypothetical protein